MFLYQTQALYALDQAAQRLDGFSEIELMQRAGLSVWREISRRWPELKQLTIFAGSGNNGGDAFVVALAARQQGLTVQLIASGNLQAQSDTARHFRELWRQDGGLIENWREQAIKGEAIVDGLLGIGLNRMLDETTQGLILRINQCNVPCIAIDIPSGLNANTGVAQPCAVKSDLCVTFIGVKTGLYLADGPDFCGELIFDDLGISSHTVASQVPSLIQLNPGNIQLPQKRLRNSHKNQFGHVLVIGGDEGMTGAASLAAQAALRSGAGVVSVLVHPNCVHALASIPELMVKSWEDIEHFLAQASVIVVGPGLGHSAAAKFCLQTLKVSEIPMVVDAGALEADFLASLPAGQIVITPHPGEAAGLLGTTTGVIQADRLAASTELVEQFSVVSVLKGSGSIVQKAGATPMINCNGNPGMASAGMGDVLAGMIAAFIAQGLSPFEASKTGVLVHALCADAYASDQDETGLIASDVVDTIPVVIKQLRHV